LKVKVQESCGVIDHNPWKKYSLLMIVTADIIKFCSIMFGFSSLLDYDSDEYESEEGKEENEEEEEEIEKGYEKPKEEKKPDKKDSLKPPTPPQKQTTPTSAAKMNFFGQAAEPVRIDPWSFFRRTGLAKEELKPEEPIEDQVEVIVCWFHLNQLQKV
jgi:hypothetical protein